MDDVAAADFCGAVVRVGFVGCEVDFAQELLLVMLEFADHAWDGLDSRLVRSALSWCGDPLLGYRYGLFKFCGVFVMQREEANLSLLLKVVDVRSDRLRSSLEN